MAQRLESFDLASLGLSSGEGAVLEVAVPFAALEFGGESYAPGGDLDARLDVSRTTGEGYSLRLRFGIELRGPCMRCLEAAEQPLAIDAREVEQPASSGEDDDLSSPYVSSELELDLRAWARDAVVLALPSQILCREECRGLCPQCGINLNEEPDHAHEREPDPRWAKLSELKLD